MGRLEELAKKVDWADVEVALAFAECDQFEAVRAFAQALRSQPKGDGWGTCGFCRWSEVHESGNARCQLPEGFMMDTVCPPEWGCRDFEALPPAPMEG